MTKAGDLNFSYCCWPKEISGQIYFLQILIKLLINLARFISYKAHKVLSSIPMVMVDGRCLSHYICYGLRESHLEDHLLLLISFRYIPAQVFPIRHIHIYSWYQKEGLRSLLAVPHISEGLPYLMFILFSFLFAQTSKIDLLDTTQISFAAYKNVFSEDNVRDSASLYHLDCSPDIKFKSISRKHMIITGKL